MIKPAILVAIFRISCYHFIIGSIYKMSSWQEGFMNFLYLLLKQAWKGHSIKISVYMCVSKKEGEKSGRNNSCVFSNVSWDFITSINEICLTWWITNKTPMKTRVMRMQLFQWCYIQHTTFIEPTLKIKTRSNCVLNVTRRNEMEEELLVSFSLVL